MKKKQQLLTQMTIHIDELVKNIELLMHINKINEIKSEKFSR